MIRFKGKFYRSPRTIEEANTNIGRIIHIPNFHLKSRWIIKSVTIERSEMLYVCDLVSSIRRKPEEWTDELIYTSLSYIDDDGIPVGIEVTEEQLREAEKMWIDKT